MENQQAKLTGKQKWEAELKRQEELERAKKLWIESEAILSLLRTHTGLEHQPTQETLTTWQKALPHSVNPI